MQSLVTPKHDEQADPDKLHTGIFNVITIKFWNSDAGGGDVVMEELRSGLQF